MIFRPRRSWWDVNGNTYRRMQRGSRKEEAMSLRIADGLLLAHYEKGYNKICEKVSQLPSVSQFDPHPSTKLT